MDTTTTLQTFGRILALDLGKRRIGLALSDPLRITAQGIDTFLRTRVRDDLEGLASLAEERGVSEFLFGEPLHMSGDESRQSVYTHEFAGRLATRTGLPVHFWDDAPHFRRGPTSHSRESYF